MRRLMALLIFIICIPIAAQAQDPPALNVYAIVGARIEVGNGQVIEHGIVLIRDGLIEAVGPNVTVPPDAEIIKGDGLVVYPGFIDTDYTQGLQLPAPQPDQDVPPNRTDDASPSMRQANRKGIRPEIHADDYLALTDELLRPERQAGFTTALALPDGGTINGEGAIVNLSGKPRRDCVVRSDVGMRFTFRSAARAAGEGFGSQGYPSSLMGIMALTRQTLLDARYYTALQNAFSHGSATRPPDDAALAALQPALEGKMPVIYEADTQNEIHRAVKMAEQFDLKLIISGGGEAWKQSAELAQYRVPVLLSLNFGPDPAERNAPAASRPGGPRVPGGGGFRRFRGNNGTQPPSQRPGGSNPDAPPGPVGTSPGASSADTTADDADVPPAALAERHRKWEEKVANAAALDKAGISFAFTTRGERGASEFFTDLRKCIKAGLPKQAALKALTLGAAQILGVDRQLGTVEPGKVAAIVVMSGDFADEKSTVKYLFIDRDKFEPGNDLGPVPQLPFGRFPADDDDGE